MRVCVCESIYIVISDVIGGDNQCFRHVSCHRRATPVAEVRWYSLMFLSTGPESSPIVVFALLGRIQSWSWFAGVCRLRIVAALKSHVFSHGSSAHKHKASNDIAECWSAWRRPLNSPRLVSKFHTNIEETTLNKHNIVIFVLRGTHACKYIWHNR